MFNHKLSPRLRGLGKFMAERVERRLAAILAADIVGYSKLMGIDEAGTLQRVKALRSELLHPKVADYNGRIVKTTGDGTLIEFPSAVNAVQHAVEVQREMAQRNVAQSEDQRIVLRMGINLGDVIIDGDDIYGDGVNVAARLEGLAEAGGICISGTVYEHVRGKLEIAFDDAGEQALKNIARPVHVYRVRMDKAEARTVLALPDKPSIAILPFQNMSGDPEQEYLADGIVEDTLTALSQISSLFVVARNSSFAFKGKSLDVREVGRQLGVRYVVEGSVRRSGDRLRVTTQLIDATDGSHLWAERYDRRVQDIFDIQDELTKEIVTALHIRLTDGEQANIWLRSTHNVEAWGYAMRGADHIWRGTATDMAQARALLERAMASDPTYAKGAALIALTYYYDNRFNYTPSREESKRKAAEWTAKALALDPDDHFADLMRSAVMTLDGHFKDAVKGMEQVLSRSPNDAFAWAAYARFLVNAEQPVEGERAVRHAMRLNPFYPVNYLGVLGDALLHQGRNPEALEVLRELVRRQPNYISAHLHLAGLHSSLGQMERAQASIAEVLRINPQYRVASASSFYLSSDEHRKRAFLESLRAAGLPD